MQGTMYLTDVLHCIIIQNPGQLYAIGNMRHNNYTDIYDTIF